MCNEMVCDSENVDDYVEDNPGTTRLFECKKWRRRRRQKGLKENKRKVMINDKSQKKNEKKLDEK